MSKKTKRTPPVKSATAHQPLLNQPQPVNVRLWSIVLPLLAFLLYSPTLSHEFALDDLAVIEQNSIVQKGFSGIPELCRTFYWQGFWDQNANLYRPASMVMFAAEYEFGKGGPAIHHFMNLLLYALSIFFLYRLLNSLLKKYSPWIPVLASLIFLAHPYHTEVVANIKSRDEILCFLFFTLSGIYFLKAKDTRLLKYSFFSSVFLFLSLMSKEGGVLFVPVLGLMLLLFRNATIKETVIALLPHFAVTAVWFGIHYYVIHVLSGPMVSYDWRHNSLLATDNFIVQRATAVGILGRYLVKLFVPYEFSYDYSYQQIPNEAVNTWVIAGVLLSVFLLILAFWNLKKNPLLAFSIFFFFITIALTSNVFFIIGATMADRFLFTPSLGMALALALFVTKLKASVKRGVMPLFIISPLLLYYAYITFERNPDWKNTETLYIKDAGEANKSGRVNYNAAVIMMNNVLPRYTDSAERRAVLDTAHSFAQRSVELDPKDPNNWVHLGVINYRLKNYQESARATLHALEVKSYDTALYSNLADAYFMGGMYDSSIYYHSFLVKNNKIFKETWNFLGSAYFFKKDYQKALDCFTSGMKIDSTYPDLVMNYANALAVNGRYPEAIPYFKKAYLLNPKLTNALYFIALTFQNMGMTDSTKKYHELFLQTQGKK